MLPTLYYLIFKRNDFGEYDVYEQHTCQEIGCVKTTETYITTCLPGHIDKFVEEYQENLIEGEVDGVEIEYILAQ